MKNRVNRSHGANRTTPNRQFNQFSLMICRLLNSKKEVSGSSLACLPTENKQGKIGEYAKEISNIKTMKYITDQLKRGTKHSLKEFRNLSNG